MKVSYSVRLLRRADALYSAMVWQHLADRSILLFTAKDAVLRANAYREARLWLVLRLQAERKASQRQERAEQLLHLAA